MSALEIATTEGRLIGSTVVKVGSFLTVDADGFILNDAKESKISDQWRSAIWQLRDLCIAQMAENLCTLYVRGSVVRGEQVDNVSDLDLCAITKQPMRKADALPVELRNQFLGSFPFISDIDLFTLAEDEFLNSPRHLDRRFMVKTLSLCVWGHDFSNDLPKYRPTGELANALHGNVDEVIDAARSVMALFAGGSNKSASSLVQEMIDKKGMTLIPSPAQIERWCGWTMKRLIRTAFALVMEREKTYTRDIFLCRDTFVRYFPSQTANVDEAVRLAVHPSSNPNAALDVVDSFGTWLSAEMRSAFA